MMHVMLLKITIINDSSVLLNIIHVASERKKKNLALTLSAVEEGHQGG